MPEQRQKTQKMDYPFIPKEVFLHLDEVLKTEKLLSLFEDSTHSIWRLSTHDKSYVLKLCPGNLLELPKSIFWQNMAKIFGLNLPQKLGDYSQVYEFLAEYSGLKVPALVACASARSAEDDAWLLTEWEEGFAVHPILPNHIQQLAQHLAVLHQKFQATYGGLVGQQFLLQDFGLSLLSWLDALPASQNLLNEDERMALQAWQPLEAVPVMLDLRWDQFLQSEQGKLTTLLDCDAFVWAPKELVLCQVKCILDQDDFLNFKKHYQSQVGSSSTLDANLEVALLKILKTFGVFG